MIPSDAYNKDYYAVMGLKPDASAHDIKMAYRRLARKYHPDLNKQADAEKNFKNLGEAYDVLKDPEKRKLYDNLRAQGPRQQEYRHSDEAAAHAWSGWQDKSAAGEFGADWFESIFGAQRQRNSQGGQTLRLKKRGFPATGPGDQLVLLKVVIPQPTTQAGKELYEKMAKELAFNPRKHLENYHG